MKSLFVRFGVLFALVVVTLLNAYSQISFNPKIDLPTRTTPLGVAIGDLDGDGRPDIVVCNNENASGSTVSVYRNLQSSPGLSASSFDQRRDFAVGQLPWDVALSDVDGDGKLDIVVSNQYPAGQNGTVSVLRNVSSPGDIQFTQNIEFAVGCNPGFIAVADIDGDGKSDIAVANINSNSVSILRNHCSAGEIVPTSFVRELDVPTGRNPVFVALADLDGDGLLDLLATPQTDGIMSVFRNMTEGGQIALGSQANYQTGNTPQSIAVADFDGDGKPDVAVGNGYSSNVALFRNVSTPGNIELSDKVDLASPGVFQIRAKDLDGDGKVDVVTANPYPYPYQTKISVLRNISTIGSITPESFEAGQIFTVGVDPWSLAVSDLDGDGRQDVVVSNAMENTISILQNTTPTTSRLDLALYLHGTGSTANPSVLTFNALAPLATVAKYKDSPGIKFSSGNPWQQVGKWNASAGVLVGDLSRLGNLRVWIGLKNSDDIGTNFDLRAELWKNNVLVTAGETYGITEVTRNPDLAKEVMVSFASFARVQITSADVVYLKILTRIGTNGGGGFLGGHSNAVGLRLYFDAISRCSTFEAELWANQSPAAEHVTELESNDEAVEKLLCAEGEFALLQNYPNPFNPSTTIVYRVSEQSSVHVEIYNSLGQLVRELVNQDQNAGVHSVKWDGTSKDGGTVSSGMYFCKVRAGGSVLTKRMLMLK